LAESASIAADSLGAVRSLLDRWRAWLSDPSVVAWRCRGCKWEIWCFFAARRGQHVCDDCGCRQFVPPEAYAWNERVMAAREERQRCEERREAFRERVRRAASEAREVEEARRRRAHRESYAALAVQSGVVASRVEYDRLSDREVDEIAAASELSGLLHADLLQARREAERSEGPADSASSLAASLSLIGWLTNCTWAAVGFGLLSVSTREGIQDWKRRRASSYRTRWSEVFGSLTEAERALVTRVFRHRFPDWAALIEQQAQP
jgi:hypothetical protein